MTTVPPPNPLLPQMLAAAASSTGTISRPTPEVAALPPGAKLTGTIIPASTPDPKTVLLATPLGDIPVRTPTQLPDGATLTIEVVRTSPAQVTVRLVSLDGQPLQQALNQAARQANQAATNQPPPTPPTATALPTAPGTPTLIPPGLAWWPGGPQQPTALPQVSAYVIAGEEADAAAAETATTSTTTPPTGNTLPLITGSDLAIRITSVILPGTDFAAARAPGMPGVPTSEVITADEARDLATPMIDITPTSGGPTTAKPDPGFPPAAAMTPSATPSSVAQTTVVQNLATTVSPTTATPANTPAAVTTPAQSDLTTPDDTPEQTGDVAPDLVLPTRAGWPASTPTPPTNVVPAAPQTVLTGTVVFSQDGAPVVQTPDGQIQLNVRANLPPGTQVTFEITGRQTPTPGIAPPPAPVPAPAIMPLSTATTGWPTLSEFIQLLQRSDPAAAMQLANAIPDGGPRTALAVMSFVQALRTGEPRQWPGDTSLRALERASPRGAHLAAQLTGEVSELSRQVRETGAEWRALPLPWQAGGMIERLRMVVRETDSEDEARKKKGGGGTRFLVDLDLSRLGPLQLDGMFRKETRSFDMMIRTRAALPDAMRQDLAGLFANANIEMNLVGSLSFQVVKKFPDPLATAGPGKDKAGLWV